MSRTLRTALRPLVATAVLVVAAAATVSAPTDDDVQTPIETVGPIGRTVVSRAAEAQVHGVRVARRLDFTAGATDRDSTTSGAWVVIDLTVACRSSSCSFGGSRLRLGRRSFAASPVAPGTAFATLAVEPRLRYRTTALFEVPRSALAAGRARLVVQGSTTTALDGVPVVTMRLPDGVASSASVPPTRLVGAVP